MVDNLKRVTKLQLNTRFAGPETGGIINLRGIDMTIVNMQDPEVKDQFNNVSKQLTKNPDDPKLFIDMSGSNISGNDMRGYDLSSFIMNGVIAKRTIFINCIFSDTSLESADLSGADFRQADLTYAKLYDANIKGANFSGANLAKTHGLGLARPEIVVDRLGQVGTIRDAKLPENIEPLRENIQEAIRSNREEVPEYAADLIDVDSIEEDDDIEEEKRGFFAGFFSRK